MPAPQRHLILLGPQPKYASLRAALKKLKLKGPVALITAGWETDEADDAKLTDAISSENIEAINLGLFGRTEQLFADDPELIKLLRVRQDELRILRDAYNDRLNHLLKAARQIIRNQDSLVNLDPERDSAIEMVRQLDREYFVRTCQLIDRYEEQLRTAKRPLVKKHRKEIGKILKRTDAILISGGHVAIILNRLKIFGILEMAPKLPVIAWSGGAMALSDQIVFFHDSPPQGPGNPELLRAGMSEFHEILPLPNARSRLNLEDHARVELFARRFDRFQCVIFDEQTSLERRNGVWQENGSTNCLGSNGHIVGFGS